MNDKEMQKPSVQSIEEMVEKNFSIFIPKE